MRSLKVSCIALVMYFASVESAIVATPDDFVLDCGTAATGPQSIKYTRQTGNTVATMVGSSKVDTCVATDAGDGTYTISNIATNCELATASSDYYLQINLRQISGVQLTDDLTFNFQCTYAAGQATATGSILDGGQIQTLSGTPELVTLDIVGNPDMTYTLSIVDPTTGAATTTAQFGDNILLQVEMSGTDEDEKGVKVSSCIVKSGGINITLVDNFCVVADKQGLSQQPGFFTASPPMKAFLPIVVFALEGSTSTEIDFECVVDICPADCSGEQNCPAPGRKRRAAEDELLTPRSEKYVRMSTGIQILPVAVHSETEHADTSSCMQSMGFIMTVAILGILLVLSMIVVVVLFTSRRRELQKQGA